VNVTWLINGTETGIVNTSVTYANYTNTSAAVGIWNVTAIANNTNGTVSQTWDWNVTALPSNTSQAPVDLGAAGNFTVLAGTEVTCTGTTINGDVGVSPGTVLTACTVVGTNHTNDSSAIAANSSFLSAYEDVSNVTVDGALTGTLAGITLSPGAYSFDTAAKTGTLTLDASGNTSAVWIFKSAADTGYLEANSFSVVMANGGVASNVYWWVPAYAALTDSNFQGTILAGTYITVTRGTFNGSALAKAAVTMTNTVVTGPSAPSYDVNLTNVTAVEASTVAGTNAT
jgi:type VI secretion system secreted protein VgrG